MVSRLKEHFSRLVRHGWFPAERPPFVTAKFCATVCEADYGWFTTQFDNAIKKSTSYIQFSAPRTQKGRRRLAFVHPTAQLALCGIITKHRSSIRKIIQTRSNTLYDASETADKAFAGLDFRKRDILRSELYASSVCILKADISRFFYTIYTHSIPWAVLGKEKAKDWHFNHNRKLRRHWSNIIDKALQACQSRETFGLPVGPDTSRIIAELILANIENDGPFAELVKQKPAIRLLDDFEVGFDSEKEAEQALRGLEVALWSFNLQLNDRKSGVHLSKNLFRDEWKRRIRLIQIRTINAQTQRRDILDFVDYAMHVSAELENAGPVAWACNRLSNIQLRIENLEVVVRAMFRISRDYPYCIRHVCAFFINRRSAIENLTLVNELKHWLETTLKRHLESGDDHEVSWLLFLSACFELSLPTSALPKKSEMPNPIVFTCLGLLREKGLLRVPLGYWDWRAHCKEKGNYGPHWLTIYESVVRKWTTDRRLIAEVDSDPIMKRLKSKKVSFLDADALSVRQINLQKKTYKKRRRRNVNKATATAQSRFINVAASITSGDDTYD